MCITSNIEKKNRIYIYEYRFCGNAYAEYRLQPDIFKWTVYTSIIIHHSFSAHIDPLLDKGVFFFESINAVYY